MHIKWLKGSSIGICTTILYLRIANGKVTGSTSDQEPQPPFFHGAELKFRCQPGFELLKSGRNRIPDTFVCHDNGHWAPPRGYTTPKCVKTMCLQPQGNSFGKIISTVSFATSYITQCVVCTI